MFIKRSISKQGGKTYVSHVLVESVLTPAGPRHKTICNLGKMDPGPKEDWLLLAERIQMALGGQSSLFPDPRVDQAVARIRERQAKASPADLEEPLTGEVAVPDVVPVKTSGVKCQDLRKVGPLHVGHQIWQRLQLDAVLKAVGISAPARKLTEVMTLNRLVRPCSELAMVGWARREAVNDVLGVDAEQLNEDKFYRNMDKLHGHRLEIERELYAREKSLFNLEGSLVLYDMTNTYFEGQAARNPKAMRGHSKEMRTDCKLVAMGLMLDADGFPIGHEVYAGNTIDGTTVKAMLDGLEARTGRKGGSTVVMDRGFASEDNLKLVRERQYDYLMAGFQQQRNALLKEFEDLDGWEEIQPSANKMPVQIKRIEKGDEVFLLCVSPARAEKERAIRERQEKRLVKDLEALVKAVAKALEQGEPMEDKELGERIGRLRERYPRAGRYYLVDRKEGVLEWTLKAEQRARAEELDGAYFLRTSRRDMGPEEIWRTYIVLTRIESAFRDLKGTLDMRPVYHQKEIRVETHVFLAVLAFHLQAVIERTLKEAGDHTSWETLREELGTHHVVTTLLPTADGKTLAIRRGSVPDRRVWEIYRHLDLDPEPMTPIRTWL
ncbi:MAG: IS1634 family transposase [Holophaga sp.]|nr:IS1634 family transposase [Holophaga sp.]